MRGSSRRSRPGSSSADHLKKRFIVICPFQKFSSDIVVQPRCNYLHNVYPIFVVNLLVLSICWPIVVNVKQTKCMCLLFRLILLFCLSSPQLFKFLLISLFNEFRPYQKTSSGLLTSVLRIRFVLVNRIRVAKNQPKSWKTSTKINENHKNIIHFFKTIKLMFTDLNIYPI